MAKSSAAAAPKSNGMRTKNAVMVGFILPVLLLDVCFFSCSHGSGHILQHDQLDRHFPVLRFHRAEKLRHRFAGRALLDDHLVQHPLHHHARNRRKALENPFLYVSACGRACHPVPLLYHDHYRDENPAAIRRKLFSFPTSFSVKTSNRYFRRRGISITSKAPR